jgi:predicted ferric reductase
VTPRQANACVWTLAAAPFVFVLPGIEVADFADASATLNLLGRLTGIAGLSCLLVAAILSCRVPGVDRPFGGLTKLWRTHHRLGAAAFLLLLSHPPLLALSAAGDSLTAAAQLLLPRQPGWGTLTGWAALLALMIFLAPSFAFFGEPEYGRWRRLHRLAAIAVVTAVAHAYLFSRTIPAPASAAIWLLLSAGAVAAVAYRLAFSRRVGRLHYVVESAAAPGNDVVELTLRPAGRHLRYLAGQFVYLTPFDVNLAAGSREEHPYTLTSAPAEPVLRVAIKDLGDASHAIQSVAIASEVGIEGPYGDFFPRGDSGARELWIAGGIGIAPFLGRLRDLAGRGARLDAHLVYCVQDQTRAHFAAELEALASRVAGARMSMHFFYQQGPLDAAFLARRCADYASRSAYVCGPEPLLERACALLAGAGVAPDRIVTEEFSLL